MRSCQKPHLELDFVREIEKSDREESVEAAIIWQKVGAPSFELQFSKTIFLILKQFQRSKSILN